VRELRDHCEAGRLDADELGQRLETAFAARTLAALDSVLADLPRAARRGPQPRRGDPRLGRRVPVLLAALLAISIISGHPAIWLAVPLLFIVVRRRSALRRVSERGVQPVRSVQRAGRGTSLA
jgi:hypothetical protein